MLLQVHDELLLEGPEDDLRRIAPELCEIMVGAFEMKARAARRPEDRAELGGHAAAGAGDARSA